MSDQRLDPCSKHINSMLAQAFRSHGVETLEQDDWVVFPQQHLSCYGAVVRDFTQPGKLVNIQMDFWFMLGPGQGICESFAGLGETREQALLHGLQNFTTNTLHVWLAAFFQPNDPQVSTEEWGIAGHPRRVVLGNVGCMGKPPAMNEAAMAWFKVFEGHIKASALSEGTHWIRLYYAQMQSKPLSCEVLLDNEIWQDVQTTMADYAWPQVEDFYSMRLFLIVQGGVGVAEAVATFCALQGRGDEEIVAALQQRGASAARAGKLVALLPLAFGRALLEGLPIQLSEMVEVRDPVTDAARTVRILEEPIFVEALRMAQKARVDGSINREQFGAVALRSSEVNAVNQALNSGSKPENLRLSHTLLFWSEEELPPGSMGKSSQR